MRPILAGNWKMHKDRAQALALVQALKNAVGEEQAVEVIVAPPFPFLELSIAAAQGSRLKVAAQNCHHEAQGAFTGEVSAPMLRSVGVSHCIVGHSERRQYFGETDELVAKKIAALLALGLTPIYCCGERRADREAGRHQDIVTAQMKAALGAFSIDDLKKVVIAYEPVWAIGTGLNATPEQAQEMHAHIRALLRSHHEDVARTVPILYGGSCKPDNAEAIFSRPDVNGGLIGGASLVAEQFVELVGIADRVEQRLKMLKG